jgi:hypothetical protein
LFGIILGTLGRQGNPAIVSKIQASLRKHGMRSYIVLFSEISPAKLNQMEADVWVQVACPRLSVDWGHQLSDRPVLSPYELFVLLGDTKYNDCYPMDYYSMSGGPWSNYHEDNRDRQWKVSSTVVGLCGFVCAFISFEVEGKAFHPWPHPNMRNRKATMTITFSSAPFPTATEHSVTHTCRLVVQVTGA